MIINRIKISQTYSNRLDVSFYRDRYDFTSKSYPSYELQQLLYVNPTVNLKGLSDDDEISFVPMEVIDEQNGIIIEQRTKKISNSKGFTKFQNNDLLWAKITPCMQNGKSAIVRNMINDIGCGSTEFYVLRPKSNTVLIEYIHYFLRNKKVLESAKNSFGGSAGQQRVSSSYLKSIKIPLPPLEIQKKIVELYSKAQAEKQLKEVEAKTLLESIDSYLLKQLDITPSETQERRLSFKVKVSNIIGKRYDPYYHRKYFVKAFEELHKSKTTLKSLKEISSLITSGITPLAGGDAYTNIENGVAFIRSGNIDIDGDIRFDDLLYLKKEVHNKKMKSSKVQKNDIMIAIVGATIGQVGIYHSEQEANINQAIALVRIEDDDINQEYVKEVVKSSIGQLSLNRLKRPVARANINLEEISSIMIPIPAINKQNDIVKQILQIRAKAKQLQEEGATLLETAKAKIEKILL